MRKDKAVIIFAVLMAAVLAYGADTYKFNPFTGKLDNIGDSALYNSYSAQLRTKATLRQQATFGNISVNGLTASGWTYLGNTLQMATGKGLVLNSGNITGVWTMMANNIQPYPSGSSRTVASIFQDATTARRHAQTAHTPNYIFGTPTSAKYPLFTPGGGFTFQRPLDLCGIQGDPNTAIYDGAPGATGATGATGPAGPYYNFVVGTVEKLAPGSTPYVNYSSSGFTKTVSYGLVTGDTGSASITQDQVFGVIDDKTSATMTLQGTADSDVKSQMLYSTGETSLWITSSGMLYMQDKAGHITWGWNNDTRVMTFSNYSFASTRKSRTIDRFGQEVQYAANGTTVIFRSYTTGRRQYYSRTTGKLQEHIEPDGMRTLYRPDGTTPRMLNYTAGRLVL